jgi:hypothetical protein
MISSLPWRVVPLLLLQGTEQRRLLLLRLR